ncbi:MAG: ABC transporter permease [Deltaproteobacteria bacterium]|nr:ABC transporter permease [Deltaproteobacteria bacterium]
MFTELFRQEALKLLTQRYPYVLLGLVLVLETTYILHTASTPPETTLDRVSPVQLWAQGVELGLRFGVYVLLVVGSMAISREFSLGTIKTFLVLPVSRRMWVGAKLAGIISLGLLITLIITGLGLALVAAFSGWGPVVLEGIIKYPQEEVWQAVALATGLTVVFLLPVCALALVVGSYFHSSGAAVGVTLLLWIVLETLSGMLGSGAKWLFPHYLYEPMNQISKMGKAMVFQWDDVAGPGLVVSGASFLVLAGILIARLDKMDITD